MSGSYTTEVSDFCLEGRFINFVIKDGYKLKGLILATHEGESYIKVAKHLRAAFDLRLPPGTWLQVVGYKKYDLKDGTVQEPPSIDHAKVIPAKTKATILVCQKSDCMKRGGKAVCQALEAALSDRGLEDQVTIKGTGCMKNCKAGPNLVMPDKTRHSRIQASFVPALMNQHFGDKSLEAQPENLREVAISNGKFWGSDS
jgi:(2Fe-2S) ferredoxin